MTTTTARPETIPENHTFDIKSEDPNPEKIMIKRQRIAILRQIVDQLKPKYRILVKLRYFKEFSYEEISEEFNLPLGTVKAQLYRSRDQLFRIFHKGKVRHLNPLH